MVNINQAIKELLAEKERLDRAIAHLEAMEKHKPAANVTPKVPKRRGRKTMDAKARREVSERMRKYWAKRKSQEAIPPESKKE